MTESLAFSQCSKMSNISKKFILLLWGFTSKKGCLCKELKRILQQVFRVAVRALRCVQNVTLAVGLKQFYLGIEKLLMPKLELRFFTQHFSRLND